MSHTNYARYTYTKYIDTVCLIQYVINLCAKILILQVLRIVIPYVHVSYEQKYFLSRSL